MLAVKDYETPGKNLRKEKDSAEKRKTDLGEENNKAEGEVKKYSEALYFCSLTLKRKGSERSQLIDRLRTESEVKSMERLVGAGREDITGRYFRVLFFPRRGKVSAYNGPKGEKGDLLVRKKNHRRTCWKPVIASQEGES